MKGVLLSLSSVHIIRLAERERERGMDYGCVGVWEAAVRECMGVKVKG